MNKNSNLFAHFAEGQTSDKILTRICIKDFVTVFFESIPIFLAN
jgi:hypothetical protein